MAATNFKEFVVQTLNVLVLEFTDFSGKHDSDQIQDCSEEFISDSMTQFHWFMNTYFWVYALYYLD